MDAVLRRYRYDEFGGAAIYLERQNIHCLCRDNSCKATQDMFSSAVMSGLWSSFELVELESLSVERAKIS